MNSMNSSSRQPIALASHQSASSGSASHGSASHGSASLHRHHMHRLATCYVAHLIKAHALLQDHDSGKQRQLGKLSFVGHSLGELLWHPPAACMHPELLTLLIPNVELFLPSMHRCCALRTAPPCLQYRALCMTSA